MSRSFSNSVVVSRSTRSNAKAPGWASPIGGRGRPSPQHRPLRCEPLEDRRMLSVGPSGENALFRTSTALFVENQGQWADEAVRYGFEGDGVNIAFTDDRLAFLLSRQEVGSRQWAVGGSKRSGRHLAAPRTLASLL